MMKKKILKSVDVCENASPKRVITRGRPPPSPPLCEPVHAASHPTRPQIKGQILVLMFWKGAEFVKKLIENVNFKQTSFCVKIFFI